MIPLAPLLPWRLPTRAARQFGAARDGRAHHGMDVAGVIGSPVRAPVEGVLHWGPWPRKGAGAAEAALVVGGGLMFVLGPLLRATSAAEVRRGDVIGRLAPYPGNAGRPSDDPAHHLHVEVWDAWGARSWTTRAKYASRPEAGWPALDPAAGAWDTTPAAPADPAAAPAAPAAPSGAGAVVALAALVVAWKVMGRAHGGR